MDRKHHWQRVYESRSPLEVSWYQREPALSLELIGNSGIERDQPIIDVGGGASLLVDRLLARGFSDISVLDVSSIALERARERLGERADSVSWIVADLTEFAPTRSYGLWHDRAVFHFLTEQQDRRAYVRVLERALAPQGHLIMAAFAIGGPERCSGLDIVQYDAARLSAELGSGFDLVEERSEDHLTPAGAAQAFAWFRFLRQ